MSKTTFTTAVEMAEDYIIGRWEALPLPAGRKAAPPKGLTGKVPAVVPEAQRDLFRYAPADANIGVRVPSIVIGLDVDHHDEKAGGDTLAAMEADFGALPSTYRLTRRDPASVHGTYFFRVPAGVKWKDNLKCIDVIQHTHRYAVGAPSVVDGMTYRWYAPGGELMDAGAVPAVADLPELPEKWVKRLKDGVAVAERVESLELDAEMSWLTAHTVYGVDLYQEEDGRRVPLPASGNLPEVFARDLGDPDLLSGSAYPAMRNTVLRWVVEAVRFGAQNITDALEKLSARYVEVVGDRRCEAVADNEFGRALSGAVGIVRAEVKTGEYLPLVDYWPSLIDRDLTARWERVESASESLKLSWSPRTHIDAETPADSRPAPKKGLVLRSFEELETVEPSWLWEVDGVGGIPVGGLTVFTGRGGVGKSTACRWLAAEITRGTLPGEFYGTPHNVLYVAAEESNSAMVKPSLLAHGADDRRVLFTEIDGEANRVDAAYMADLTEQCIVNDVRLVVVDPMSNYLHGANMNAAAEVREALRPWTTLAEAIGGAVVAIFHQNKSGSSDLVFGIGGSAAVGEVARSVVGFARDTDSGLCVLSQDKNNLGPMLPDLSYLLEPVHLPGRKNPGMQFTLGGESDVSAGEIQTRNRQVAAGEKETAKTWLRSHLQENGPVLKQDVVDAARGRYSETSIEKAAQSLKVHKGTRHEGGRVTRALWSLG